jgi:hypothetical protein
VSRIIVATSIKVKKAFRGKLSWVERKVQYSSGSRMRGRTAISPGDDSDAGAIGQPISGQDSESLLHARLVFADLVSAQITWVETDVFNEKKPAGHRCWLRRQLPLGVYHNMPAQEEWGRSTEEPLPSQALSLYRNPANFASTCQCLGCGRRWPERMNAA